MIRRYTKFLAAAWLGLMLNAVPARAHDLMDLDELMAAFNWDFDTAEVRTEKLREGFYVLFGIGGNIAVSIGEQDDG